MTILRDDLDAGRVDLSEVVDRGAEPLPPVHPGEHLADLMSDHGLSAYRVARACGVPHNRVTAIMAGERAVTADTALRLAAAFGVSAELWMRAQASYDLEVARRDVGPSIARGVEPVLA